FWEEIGGVAESESEYKIPLHLPQRALEEVKRHKRSEWKKRQQLTAALEASVMASLTALQGAQPSSL
ncbi:DUF535 family protein, partial [Klebsiella pneumoniae]|uniref:DUF535 family protein n=1 Tax=Klebsiella pneumoniae TaxID=573 RepID=UPI003EE37E5A